MSTLTQLREWISRWLAIFVAVGVASLAVLLWQVLTAQELNQVKLAVEEEALTLKAEITERIEPKILALVRMAKRWEVRGGTPREEWEIDATLSLVDQPGMRGITRVDPSYIIRWVPRLEGRRSYIGQNVGRTELRRAALEEARESREMQVTSTIGVISGDTIFLVFVPLFVGERFDGYIAGIFRISELLEPLLSEHASLGYSISVFDGDEAITTSSVANRPAREEWIEETDVEIRNVTWRIQVWPEPELIANMRSSLPEVALAMGLLLALLMSLTVRLAQTARRRAEEVGAANHELEEQITERKRAADALRLIVEGTASATGDDFFRSFVRHLATALQCPLTFIAELVDAAGTRARTISFWRGDDFAKNIEYALAGTPCEKVIAGKPSFFPQGVRELFPNDQWLAKIGAESYLGIPFFDSSGRVIGHMGALAEKPMREEIFTSSILKIFAARAGAELERKRAEEAIQTLNEELEQRVQDRTTQLQQSEEKFRGLLESAPDAIVGVGSDGRMVIVNAQTEKLFGYSREELLGEPIEMLVPYKLREMLVQHRQNYHSNPHTRLMEDGLELAGRRKDGSEFPVEISLSPMETEEGPMVTAIIRDITSRKQTQEALRASEDRFRAQYKGLPVSTLTWQRVAEDFLLIDHNDVSLVFSRGQIPNFIGKTASDFYNDRPDLLDDMWRCFREKVSIKRETPFRMRTTGEDKHIAFTYAFIPPNLVMTHTEDITEREQMAEDLRQKEEQLRHAQKMEAIGQLAGGVAHDFNNLLTGIIGYSDLLIKKLGPGHPLLKQAGQIKKAGDQAAALTGQLLAFSRKQVLQPQVVDLNEIVTGIDEMLRRLVGDNITLVTSLSPALGKTKADPSQIEQVILNLVSNARDAMPDGGTLTIATENIERKQANGYPGLETKAKRHVMLTVSDTGSGMDEETLAHVFEPFFTTKEKGKGTGLGLASVYGVVQQSGGHIQVSSEFGRGTKFQIYLSQVDKTLPSPKPDAIQPVPSGGWETILLVEDSDPVRELVCQCLQDEGYTVLEASQSAEAIQIAEKKQQKIDMLLTDVIMPGMSGPDLAQIILKDHKDIKVLYLSGYSDHLLVLQGTSKPKISFLAKPFTLEALLHKVREVFDASKSRPPERNSPAKVKAKTTRSPKPAKATRGRPKSKS